MTDQKQVLSVEALRAAGACEEGMAWIKSLIDLGDEQTAIDALHRYRPTWAQWAFLHGFNVQTSRAEFGWDNALGAYFQTGDRRASQMAGHYSTQVAADEAVQTAGNVCHQNAGNDCYQTAGNEAVQKAGHWATQKASHGATQVAGDCSVQKAGRRASQMAGHYSTQVAGACSTQTAGNEAVQTAGRGSTQTAGAQSRFRATEAPGVFVCRYEDCGVWKMASIVCDGKRIKANVFYTFDTEDETWKEAVDQSEPLA